MPLMAPTNPATRERARRSAIDTGHLRDSAPSGPCTRRMHDACRAHGRSTAASRTYGWNVLGRGIPRLAVVVPILSEGTHAPPLRARLGRHA
jgi:hypothetical protein